MSWFKRSGSRQSSGSPEVPTNQERTSTDPHTCLEVFSNHWQQALNVIEKKRDGSAGTSEDVDTVMHNFEHMVTLLVGEDGIDGMPGPILHFLLEKDILEKFCSWTIQTRDGLSKLKYEQLRMFELAINQSKQLLLIHKPVIRPLMKLLTSCSESGICTEDIEYRTVLVLHQICVCMSQQTVILESFFNTNADHGPAKFLIFSLLISYIHREGPIGQNARDALLLIMALSVKYPHIGQYTADSDFCPVLATGLSGLYSSLPRKITPPTDDWYMLTEDDVARIPDLQMFLNSLEFCNAVIQIGHPVVKNQLIKFIYDGFLVPVLGPALHQNSREEVMTATAYMELFLRRITEPVLIRAFLKFILLDKNDEIVILDSLITRINSSSRLSLVSLQLFKTLVSLNCEDVMLQLIFKFLIPCTHVMVSQRRSVRDLDLYSKSAEKFLSLRPSCCMSTVTGSAQSPSSPPRSPIPENGIHEVCDQPADYFESSYLEYLQDAHSNLTRCSRACRKWTAPYNGEMPPPDCFIEVPTVNVTRLSEVINKGDLPNINLISPENINSKPCAAWNVPKTNGVSVKKCEIANTESSFNKRVDMSDDNMTSSLCLSKLISSLESVESFIEYLEDLDVPLNTSRSIDDSVHSLDLVLDNISQTCNGSLMLNDTDLNSGSSCSFTGISNHSDPSLDAIVRSSVEVPKSLNLKDTSSYVEISMSSSNKSAVFSDISHRSFMSPDSVLSPSRWNDIELSFSLAASPSSNLSSRSFTPRYPNSSPNIGSFLSALFSKLESMMQNSLYTNLLLTGIISQLASFPQPLLRSFLLNHNLVFQPTVKSLAQVLSSIRQKVDQYALTVPNFVELIALARKNLLHRMNSPNDSDLHPVGLAPSPPVKQVRAATISESPGRERRSPSQSLRDLLFKRPQGRKGSKLQREQQESQLQRVPGGSGYLFINKEHEEAAKRGPEETRKTWNVVYCAIVLEEFLMELAALAQEHAVLSVDDGYGSRGT